MGDTLDLGKSALPVCRFQRESSLCAGVTSGALYHLSAGCAVEPGTAQWVVKVRSPLRQDEEYTVFTREQIADGGEILTVGSLFFLDESLKEPENIWDAPYANRSLAASLLGMAESPLPVSDIGKARRNTSGELLRLRGYVTAGTANPHNRFPDTLYIQDETGAIAVVPFTQEGISIGTAVEVIGYVQERFGNPVLKPVSHKLLNAEDYRYLPKTGDWVTLLDWETHGGELVEVEGTCHSTERDLDGALSRFTLMDDRGNTVRVVIGSGIGNGSDGKNTLYRRVQTGRTVRAMGLLHREESGETVIRVRNCEEVVYVSPLSLIPRTGDGIGLPLFGLVLSFGLLVLLTVRKKRQ